MSRKNRRANFNEPNVRSTSHLARPPAHNATKKSQIDPHTILWQLPIKASEDNRPRTDIDFMVCLLFLFGHKTFRFQSEIYQYLSYNAGKLLAEYGRRTYKQQLITYFDAVDSGSCPRARVCLCNIQASTTMWPCPCLFAAHATCSYAKQLHAAALCARTKSFSRFIHQL